MQIEQSTLVVQPVTAATADTAAESALVVERLAGAARVGGFEAASVAAAEMADAVYVAVVYVVVAAAAAVVFDEAGEQI